MKKLFSIIVASIMAISMLPNVLAADEDIKIIVDGSELRIAENDTKPFIEEGRTLVPMRAIFEALGATVEWDDTTKTVTSHDKNDNTVTLQVGSDTMKINNTDLKLDVPAKVIDGRTVVPVRAVAESLNADVKWDNETRTIYISSKNILPSEQPAMIGEIHSSIQHETESPEWITNLPAAQDKSATQLFVVAGMGMDKTTATISMHERDENGAWKQILSTPGYVGKNGLCADIDHKEGCGQTPIGIYHFNKAFGIADDPGCAIGYIKVTDNTYWSGDMGEGMRYNEMVDINDYPSLDMENSEHIVDYEYQYQYCLNISFNEDGTAGRGSAIFLHCLGPVKPYTGGCVAMPENIMKMVMQRVHEDCVVVIDTLDNLNGSL